MADEYIKRESAINKLLQCADDYDPHYSDITVAHAVSKIKEISAADVVEVVRCGECECWDTTWNPRAAKNGEHYCPSTDLYTTPDWFCAYGDRREVQNG